MDARGWAPCVRNEEWCPRRPAPGFGLGAGVDGTSVEPSGISDSPSGPTDHISAVLSVRNNTNRH